MKTRIKFINHSSVLIASGSIGLLCDPWYEGEAFHKGWNLLVEHNARLIQPLLDHVTHIWISHEHPDHFSVKFFNNYAEKLKQRNIKILFQKTEDGRVKRFIKSKGVEFIEIPLNKKFTLDNTFEICCIKDGFYDSGLLVSTPDLKILNLNDCEITSESRARQIKKIAGSVDVLLSQFSYAAWKGGAHNLQWRKEAAAQKIKTLKLQVKILQPKYLIPFASFIYFSNPRNFYLNDSSNTPQIIFEALQDKVKVIVMKPFDVFSGEWSESQNLLSMNYWGEKYISIEAKQGNKYQSISFEELQRSFSEYQVRLANKNNLFFMKILKKLSPIKAFESIVIFMDDINTAVVVNIFNEKLIRIENKSDADLIMGSESLKFLFENSFGFDTLTVNGCFEEGRKGGFLRATKTLAIENFNNLGFIFGWRILLNIKLINIFLKKLFIVSKKLNDQRIQMY